MNRIRTADTQAHPLRTAIMVLVLCLVGGGSAQVLAVDAGRFFVVVGDVRVVNANGQSRRATRGSVLATGDTVFTSAGALAQIRMVDDGRISLRENTDFKLEDYNFKQSEPSTGRMFLNLLRGSLRSLTGLIGRRNRSGYRLRTPHATLGIRGTDHETTVLLQQREGFQPGTFDVVFDGGTVLRTARGSVNISPRQAGYVTAADLRPRIIEIPRFLRTAQQRPARPSTPVASPKNDQKAARTKRSTGAAKSNTANKSLLRTPLSKPRATGATRSSGGAKTLNPKLLRTPSLTTPGRTLQPGRTAITPSLSDRPALTTPTITQQAPTLTTPRAPTLTAPVPQAPIQRAPIPNAPIANTPILRTPTLTTPTTRAPTLNTPSVTTVPQAAPTLRNPSSLNAPRVIQQAPSSR